MVYSRASVVLFTLGACAAPFAPSPSPDRGTADPSGRPAEGPPHASEPAREAVPDGPLRYPVTGRVTGERFGEVSGEASCVDGGTFSVDPGGSFAFSGRDEPCRLQVFLRYDGMIGRGPEVLVTRASATGIELAAPRLDEMAVLNDAQIALLESIAGSARRRYEASEGELVASREHAELLEHHIRRARERRAGE